MSDAIFFLGYTHVCHVYEDGIRIRHEQDAMLQGIRLDKHQAQLLVNGLVANGVAERPLTEPEKLDRLLRKYQEHVKSTCLDGNALVITLEGTSVRHNVLLEIGTTAAELFKGTDLEIRYQFHTVPVPEPVDEVALESALKGFIGMPVVDRVVLLEVARQCHEQLRSSSWYAGYEITEDNRWVVYGNPGTKENLAEQMVRLWQKTLGKQGIPFELVVRKPNEGTDSSMKGALELDATLRNKVPWYKGFTHDTDGLKLHVVDAAEKEVRKVVDELFTSWGYEDKSYTVVRAVTAPPAVERLGHIALAPNDTPTGEHGITITPEDARAHSQQAFTHMSDIVHAAPYIQSNPNVDTLNRLMSAVHRRLREREFYRYEICTDPDRGRLLVQFRDAPIDRWTALFDLRELYRMQMDLQPEFKKPDAYQCERLVRIDLEWPGGYAYWEAPHGVRVKL